MIGSTGLKEHRGSSLGEAAEPHPPPAGRFADVPPGYPNEEDIYLVVHRGIVRGTSANTYGPLQAVTREEVALSLIRLAVLVGIEVPPAGDSRFSDVGQLPYESRAAVDQLTTKLEISYGTSATTFSPSQAVTRGQMALFLQRLMNRIPLLQERGRTPDDVIHNTQVSEGDAIHRPEHGHGRHLQRHSSATPVGCCFGYVIHYLRTIGADHPCDHGRIHSESLGSS